MLFFITQNDDLTLPFFDETKLPITECILSNILTDSDNVSLQLTELGNIVNKYITRTNDIYHDLNIEHYVIMPNHIHFIICIKKQLAPNDQDSLSPGISKFVATLKRLVDKECGYNIWQRNYHDHIIRNKEQYDKIFTYIQNNPILWKNDSFYNCH